MLWLTRWFKRADSPQTAYRRGVAAAEKGDHDRAFACYTAVIDDPNTTGELRAMALVNRAFIASKQRRFEHARVDLQTVLTMPGAPPAVKSAAREKLLRLGRYTVAPRS